MTGEEQTGGSRRWREALILAAILLLGLSLRLLFLSPWASTPLYHQPFGDEEHFHHSALVLLGQAPEDDAFMYQPLYPMFLAAAYGVAGVNLGLIRHLQLGIGLLGILVFYGLGRELGGKGVGRLSALGAAAYGPLVFFEGQLLAPALIVPLLAGALWALLRSCKRSWVWGMLPAGLLMGLALMGRPNLLLLLPVAGLWWLWQVRAWKLRLTGLGLALLGLALGLAPSWIHNAVRGHPFTPVSTSGGHSFYLGNNPQASGRFNVPRGQRIDDSSHAAYWHSLRALAEQAEGRELDAAEVSDYWYGRGLDFWREHPGRAIALVGKKLFLSLSSEEMAIHIPYYVGADIAPVLNWLLRFGLIFAFAMLGVLMSLQGGRGACLLGACFAAGLLSMLIFYVADRYRLPMVACLIPLAALGIVRLRHRVVEGGLRRTWPWLLVLAAVFTVTQIPVVGPRAKARAFSGFANLMGRAEGERGRLDEAERWFQEAIRRAGPHGGAVARGNMGLLMEKRSRPDQARQHYLKAAALAPENRFVRIRLALLAEDEGRWSDAIRWWKDLSRLEADPAKLRAHIAKLRREHGGAP